MTYIEVRDEWPSKSGKTMIWPILTKEGKKAIGHVAWFGRWRKYAFFSNGVFEEVCLREIADFIEQRTREHKRNERRA